MHIRGFQETGCKEESNVFRRPRPAYPCCAGSVVVGGGALTRKLLGSEREAVPWGVARVENGEWLGSKMVVSFQF